MNRLGMIVDISHISDEAVRDVLEVTSAPVIASHSNARTLADSPRNLPDDLLRAVADNNGVVMVTFMNYFLDPDRTELWGSIPRTEVTGSYWFTHPRHPDSPLSLLVDHIDHIVQVAGIDHVGLGSDFDGTPMLLEDLKDVSDFPNITAELVSRGYSDEDIRKILGGNVLRVLADVEAVAAQP
jgi:membrane dipeptidase